MARRSTWLRPTALVVLAGMILAACASDAPQDTLEPEGPIARDIDNLVNPVFFIAGVVFVFVEVGVLVLMWKFRRRHDDDEDEVPTQTHGNIPLELGWTILPALILAVVGVLTVQTIWDIADEPGDDGWDGRIEVVGKQWWWEYRYFLPGNDTNVPDFYTANDLVMPAGQGVELSVTSEDVIHSFWIPALNGKMDAVPGRHHKLVLESDGEGTFVGQCTEYCGLSHGYMRQRVVAMSGADFEEWMQHQMDPVPPAQAASLLDQENDSLEAQGAQLFVGQCSSCHLVRGINDEEFASAANERGPDVAGNNAPAAGDGEAAGTGQLRLNTSRAPELTHMMSRGVFAGGEFDLWLPSDEDAVTPSAADIGNTEVNVEDLSAWLRNPPGQKPMDPDNGQGMPNLGLSEENIEQLIAFLETLE